MSGSAAVPFICTEWLLTPALLDCIDGVAVTVSVRAVGFFSTACDFEGKSVFVSLDFQGMSPGTQRPGPRRCPRRRPRRRLPTSLSTALLTKQPTALPTPAPTPKPGGTVGGGRNVVRTARRRRRL